MQERVVAWARETVQSYFEHLQPTYQQLGISAAPDDVLYGLALVSAQVGCTLESKAMTL